MAFLPRSAAGTSAELRRKLSDQGLDASAFASCSPSAMLKDWIGFATEQGMYNANAMVLATADAQGRPSARNVLCKGIQEDGLEFFSNYQSQKGRALAENPQAEVLFSWLPLERQVRVHGSVERASGEASDAYWASRAYGSRLAAASSQQSRVVADRPALDAQFDELAHRYPEHGDTPVPRPSTWGGFILRPDRFEFWQGRHNRFHDRIVLDLQSDGSWRSSRIQP